MQFSHRFETNRHRHHRHHHYRCHYCRHHRSFHHRRYCHHSTERYIRYENSDTKEENTSAAADHSRSVAIR